MENSRTETKIIPECPLCKTHTTFRYLESHTDPNTTKEYKLYECGNCKAQFWLPLKNPGAGWYENDERYAGANADPTLEPNWNHRKVISFLKPFEGKVFDIGCGTGNFLAWAMKNKWEVFGIDFDRNAVRASKEVFGLPNIEVATLQEFYDQHKNDNKKFDLITYFDVFEHIDNHNEFIETIRNLLTDDGYVSMSMPYRGGAHWLQLNDVPPRHLTRWNRGSLATFLERHGFAVRYIKRVPASYLNIVMKFRFRYGKRFSFNLVNKVKQTGAEKTGQTSQKDNSANQTLKIRAVKLLAKIKDIVLFGIPAGIIWLGLVFSKKRYTGLFAIAQKIPNKKD